MGKENPTFEDSINSVRGEFLVLNKYLKASGFHSLGFDDNQIVGSNRHFMHNIHIYI